MHMYSQFIQPAPLTTRAASKLTYKLFAYFAANKCCYFAFLLFLPSTAVANLLNCQQKSNGIFMWLYPQLMLLLLLLPTSDLLPIVNTLLWLSAIASSSRPSLWCFVFFFRCLLQVDVYITLFFALLKLCLLFFIFILLFSYIIFYFFLVYFFLTQFSPFLQNLFLCRISFSLLCACKFFFISFTCSTHLHTSPSTTPLPLNSRFQNATVVPF